MERNEYYNRYKNITGKTEYNGVKFPKGSKNYWINAFNSSNLHAAPQIEPYIERERQQVPIPPSFREYTKSNYINNHIITTIPGTKQKRVEYIFNEPIQITDNNTYLNMSIEQQNKNKTIRQFLAMYNKIKEFPRKNYISYGFRYYYEGPYKLKFNPLKLKKSDLNLSGYILTYRTVFRRRNEIELNVDDIRFILQGGLDRHYQETKIISVFIDSIDRQEAGRGGQTYQQITNKYLIVSPETITNCLYVSASICLEWDLKDRLKILNDKDYQNERGKALKKKIMPHLTLFSDISSVQELCNKLNINIELYNNIFEKTLYKSVIDPEKKKIPICIQLTNNHFVSLIKIEDIKNLYPNYTMPVKVPKIKNTEIEKIRKFNNGKKEEIFDNKMIVTWDVETFQENGLVYSYKAGLAYFVNNEQKYNIFTGLDCMTQLMKYVEQNINFFNGKYFYAHNGGKFDMNLLISEDIIKNTYFKINGIKCTELNNAWIEFTLVNGKNEIYFRDSYRLFLCGLSSICEDLKVKHRKLEGVIEHHKVTRNNFMDFDKDHKYLIHDCLGLLECLESFGESTFKSKNIAIYKCLTSASLSKKSFYKNYYDYKNFPLYTLNPKMDEYIRQGYYGGHVECFAIGEINKYVFYYDFTSLYPYEGCKDLPFGYPEYIKASLINLITFFGFVKVEVTGTKEMLNDKRAFTLYKRCRW